MKIPLPLVGEKMLWLIEILMFLKENLKKNLEKSGYNNKGTSKDGKATTYEKNGKSYTIRNNSGGRPSADYRKNAGSKDADVKIRLKP